MASIEVGRICVKLLGREVGKKCVIVDVIDKNFALVTGPKSITGVRRRRTNVDHLEPTPESVEVKKGAGDEEVEKALTQAKKAKFMKEELVLTKTTN
ncbi:MAG: 50S ribosomal protein L14e [Candidatus Bathyarchaeia archaeon]|jgi:large subunit ribosomal protein L14e|nr:50S ribosomal protein L14e [Candidatus Bathyarchaeia archaeon]